MWTRTLPHLALQLPPFTSSMRVMLSTPLPDVPTKAYACATLTVPLLEVEVADKAAQRKVEREVEQLGVRLCRLVGHEVRQLVAAKDVGALEHGQVRRPNLVVGRFRRKRQAHQRCNDA